MQKKMIVAKMLEKNVRQLNYAILCFKVQEKHLISKGLKF